VPHTGALVAVDTFFVDHLKGVGKLYLQTAIDCRTPRQTLHLSMREMCSDNRDYLLDPQGLAQEDELHEAGNVEREGENIWLALFFTLRNRIHNLRR